MSRNPYEEEQRTGFKYINKPANYKSFDAQNKLIYIFRARNFVQCNEINLDVLLSACITVERSGEHRFPSGLPAVGAAPCCATLRLLFAVDVCCSEPVNVTSGL